MLKLVTSDTRIHSAAMPFGGCAKKRRDLKMCVCFFLASLEPGCNEHRRTLIRQHGVLTCGVADSENMRLTPKLQVFYKHSWILQQNTAGCDMLPAMQPNNVSVTACLAPLNKKNDSFLQWLQDAALQFLAKTV